MPVGKQGVWGADWTKILRRKKSEQIVTRIELIENLSRPTLDDLKLQIWT